MTQKLCGSHPEHSGLSGRQMNSVPGQESPACGDKRKMETNPGSSKGKPGLLYEFDRLWSYHLSSCLSLHLQTHHFSPDIRLAFHAFEFFQRKKASWDRNFSVWWKSGLRWEKESNDCECCWLSWSALYKKHNNTKTLNSLSVNRRCDCSGTIVSRIFSRHWTWTSVERNTKIATSGSLKAITLSFG